MFNDVPRRDRLAFNAYMFTEEVFSGTSTEPEQCMTPGVIRTTAKLMKTKDTLSALDNLLDSFNFPILLG